MGDTNKLLRELIQKVDSLDKKVDRLSEETESNFKGVNKRLDSIDYELKKLNTVTRYQDKWDNIPA